MWAFDSFHRQNFYLLKQPTDKEIVKFIKKHSKEIVTPPPFSDGCTFMASDMKIYIILRDKNLSTLMHEITHAAVMALLIRGYKPTLEDHEELAYMVGFLTSNFVRQKYVL